jgi:hypothetical protein
MPRISSILIVKPPFKKIVTRAITIVAHTITSLRDGQRVRDGWGEICWPVSILVREDVGAGIGHSSTEAREEDHVLGGHGDEVRATVLLLGSLLAIPVDPSEERVDVHCTAHDDDQQSPHDEATLVASSAGSGEDVEADIEEDGGLREVGKDLEHKGSSSLSSRRHILSGIPTGRDGTEENRDNATELESLWGGVRGVSRRRSGEGPARKKGM